MKSAIPMGGIVAMYVRELRETRGAIKALASEGNEAIQTFKKTGAKVDAARYVIASEKLDAALGLEGRLLSLAILNKKAMSKEVCDEL